MKKGALAVWGSSLVVVLASNNPRTAFVKIIKGEDKDSTTCVAWEELQEVSRRVGNKTSEMPSPAADPAGCPACGSHYPTYMNGIECANCGYYDGASDFTMVTPPRNNPPPKKNHQRRTRRGSST